MYPPTFLISVSRSGFESLQENLQLDFCVHICSSVIMIWTSVLGNSNFFSAIVIHIRKQVCNGGGRRLSQSKTWPNKACHSLLFILPYHGNQSLMSIEPFAALTKGRYLLHTISCHSSVFDTVSGIPRPECWDSSPRIRADHLPAQPGPLAGALHH